MNTSGSTKTNGYSQPNFINDKIWFQKTFEGQVHTIQEPRKRWYIEKEESIAQLKLDYANGDIPNRIEFIQRMARFQGAAHIEELIRPDDLNEFEGEEANNDLSSGSEDDSIGEGD